MTKCQTTNLTEDDMKLEDILKNYDVDKETGCWNWKGAIYGSRGYGQVRYGPKSKQWSCHRLMAHLYIRPLKKGEIVHHKCNNPLCMNPKHLEIKSSQGSHVKEEHTGPRGPYSKSSFQLDTIHRKIIKHAMDMYSMDKNEAHRCILEEWLYYVASK